MNYQYLHKHQGFPGGSDGKASACNVGDPGSIPGSGRSPGEENGNPLQYSFQASTLAWKIPWTVACQVPLFMDSPGKNTGVG